MHRRFTLLGASRGLGWATYQQLFQRNLSDSFLLCSRKIKLREQEISKNTILIEQDFSKSSVNSDFFLQLKKFNPTDLIYFAGGGPYGDFVDKKWSDHLWSLHTSFLYPAELLHRILTDKENWPSLRNLVFIGSAVAETKPDPKASSYAAAKHALKGLIETVQLETEQPRIQIFSPGYMQTDLLPVNSEPRQKKIAENPVDVAKKLIALIEKND